MKEDKRWQKRAEEAEAKLSKVEVKCRNIIQNGFFTGTLHCHALAKDILAIVEPKKEDY